MRLLRQLPLTAGQVPAILHPPSSIFGPPPPRRQAGSAVIVVLALLAIILIYVAGNIRTLYHLGRELNLLDRQQTRRLQTATPATNPPPAVIIATNTVPRPATN